MRYRFIDGYEFSAVTPDEICRAIWKSMKFAFHDTLGDWMVANAHIMNTIYGHRIRTDTTAHHVKDMLRCGVLAQV